MRMAVDKKPKKYLLWKPDCNIPWERSMAGRTRKMWNEVIEAALTIKNIAAGI